MGTRRADVSLTLFRLRNSPSARAGYARAIPGFTRHWWENDSDPVDSSHRHSYSIYQGGEEVARVLLDPRPSLHINEYRALGHLTEPVEIFRFEVREHLQRRGIGRRAIQSILALYKGQDFYAFGDEARFWRGIGWQEYPRVDGDPHMVPLFVQKQA